ncbi:MFS transporter [Chromobacterium sp. IIBBL 290-4]|uniref:MFS transporter n=1 Tax=Chromobacterium sp. IIBBL 290-4 TaxID=2953890 RepID=UPI0020B6FBD9|nr:MFS transporter [Chromobacterium sp. IIBBL 290-4]UTH75363.1 MFS transporter [Chromobacterium sp. IIBBL 290-4]
MEYRKRVATVYLLGFFIDLANLFVGNVAFPAIVRDFHCGVTELAWVGTAYILGLTVVIPLGGWLAARWGGKRAFMFSLLLFILASFAAGCARSLPELVAWRALQGLGGGLLIPLGQTMTYRLFHASERPGLTAAILLVGQLAPALSPMLGGLAVDGLGWRWIFWLNAPLAALPLCLAWLWLREEREPEPAAAMDWRGLFLGAAALLSLLLGLSELAQASARALGAACVLLSLASAAAYVRHSRRCERPLLRLDLLGEPLLRQSMWVYLSAPGVFMGVSLAAMLYLQQVLGMAAGAAGLLMLPWSLAAFFAISLTGRRYRTWGPQPLIMSGAAAQAAGILLLLAVESPDQWLLLTLSYAAMGLGGSLCSSASQSTAFLRIPPARMAEASAWWNINRQTAFCLGTALVSLLLSCMLAAMGVSDAGAASARSAASLAFHACFLIAACAMLAPLWLGARMRNDEALALAAAPQTQGEG